MIRASAAEGVVVAADAPADAADVARAGADAPPPPPHPLPPRTRTRTFARRFVLRRGPGRGGRLGRRRSRAVVRARGVRPAAAVAPSRASSNDSASSRRDGTSSRTRAGAARRCTARRRRTRRTRTRGTLGRGGGRGRGRGGGRGENARGAISRVWTRRKVPTPTRGCPHPGVAPSSTRVAPLPTPRDPDPDPNPTVVYDLHAAFEVAAADSYRGDVPLDVLPPAIPAVGQVRRTFAPRANRRSPARENRERCGRRSSPRPAPSTTTGTGTGFGTESAL